MSIEILREFIKEEPEAYAPVLLLKRQSELAEREREQRISERLEKIKEAKAEYEKRKLKRRDG